MFAFVLLFALEAVNSRTMVKPKLLFFFYRAKQAVRLLLLLSNLPAITDITALHPIDITSEISAFRFTVNLL